MEPGIDTKNFSIFTQRDLQVAGLKRTIEAGHSFATEQDQLDRRWSRAWCYTTVVDDGLNIKIDLGSRETVDGKPAVPRLESVQLTRVGLSLKDLLYLAENCPWLDGKSFDHGSKTAVSDLPPAVHTLVGDVLYHSGPIRGDFVNELQRRKFTTLSIESEGGLVDAALVGGRWLRANRKLVTTRTNCLSACVFVLAGGAIRNAEPAAEIGVHRFIGTSDNPATDIEVAQAKSADIVRYLQEMGVSEALWIAMAETPSGSIKVIDHATLRKWRLLSAETVEVDDENYVEFGPRLLRLVGYDAPGHDLPGMPIRGISENMCSISCGDASQCVVATYDASHKACFLKGDVSSIETFDGAVVLYKDSVRKRISELIE